MNPLLQSLEASEARAPEHSLPLMRALSGGAPLRIGDYIFYHADDWLAAIGYPLSGAFSLAEFEAALEQAAAQTGACSIHAIAPQMPAARQGAIVERDRYWLWPAKPTIPARLRKQCARAAQSLEVVESSQFTPAHRRLWAEFLRAHGNGMNPRVQELYAKAPQAMEQARPHLLLLDAVDRQGRIAASLLLDFWPRDFASYVIGARSTSAAIPHAMDLLFLRMAELAQARGKRYIHLGLGVNPGILRFKRKWGALPGRQFRMAQWEAPQAGARQKARGAGSQEALGAILAKALLSSPQASARQMLQSQPPERPFAMLWEVEKNGRKSWLGGTAHFFPCSFATSFRELFAHASNVIFEGPLDADFLNQASEAGSRLAPGARPLIEELEEAEIRALERAAHGPQGPAARLLGLRQAPRVDVRQLLARSSAWHAFFTLWTAFLERRGWRQSVDMEAWRIAGAMGKKIIAMENLEEQLDALNSLPRERALRFLRGCGSWPRRSRQNAAAYLAGDLERMMGSSAEFPTRTEHIVDKRDQRFRERMRPYLEAGGAVALVGSAHLVNLRHMLAEDGFNVIQRPHGLWPKIHLAWRGLARPDRSVSWQIR